MSINRDRFSHIRQSHFFDSKYLGLFQIGFEIELEAFYVSSIVMSVFHSASENSFRFDNESLSSTKSC